MTWQNEGPDRWEDPGQHCIQCGLRLRPMEGLRTLTCDACRHVHCEGHTSGPLVAFVLWKGVRLGFDSKEKARTFVENWKKANHQSVYSGARDNEPELEPELVLVEE